MELIDKVIMGYFLIIIFLIVRYVFLINRECICDYNSPVYEIVSASTDRVEEFSPSVYMLPRHGISTSDDQDAFLAMKLTPSDVVGKNPGYPIEGLTTGGYIPLPYSSINGITTNENLAINNLN
jgi:hypothetical protein